MTKTLRLPLLLLFVLPLLFACSGPDEPESEPTATAIIATPAETVPAQTPTVEPDPAPTSTQEPAAPTATANPPDDPATPAVEATLEPTPLGQEPPPADTTPYVPDPRPVDQHVELPDVDAHYALNITELDVDTGFVRVSQTITLREFRMPPPDQLYLQVVPAGYGFFTLDSMTLDGQPVTPATLNDGLTLVIDMPGGIQAPAELHIEYHLNVGGDATGWGYTMLDADVLRLGYWYPAISDDHGMSDLLDPSYTRIADFDVTVAADPDVAIAHSGERQGSETLDDGRVLHQFSSADTRDFALVLSRNFQVSSATSATGVEIEYFWRPASDSEISAAAAEQRRQDVLFWTADAVDRLSELLGPYPYVSLHIVDSGPSMPGGVEFAMLIYINPNYHELDRLIYHEVGHEWFYAIIGTRTLVDGWIDEGAAEFFERGLPTDFSEVPPVPAGGYQYPLDAHYLELLGSDRNASYLAIYEQGARFYYDVLGLMGWDDFWAAMRDFYDRFALDIATAYDLLATWQLHSDADLRPLFNDYFRYEWIDNLPDPGVEIQQGWVPIGARTPDQAASVQFVRP